MSKLRHLTASVLCIALPAQALAQGGAPAPAPATPPAAAAAPAAAVLPLSDALQGEAKDAFESGKLLYGDGDFAGATLKFARAYELSKDPRLLWNMGAAEKNLRHYAKLEQLLTQYLASNSETISEADRMEGRALLDAVKPFVAELTINVSEPGASVQADDVELGKSPLSGPVRLDMGVRKFHVSKAGFKDANLTRDLQGGTKTVLDVPLAAEQHVGRLRVAAESGASIRVDGKLMGLGEWQGQLPSGSHLVEVSATGKQPWHSDSNVQDGQLTTMLVSLQTNPSASGIPTWVWVVGGAVAAGGLGVGSYFLFKPGTKGPPPPTEGSLATVELPLFRHH